MLRFFLHPDDEAEHEERRLPGTKMLPNALTIAALCVGLTALRFGIDGRWTNAMVLVLLAAALDGIDGMVARLLKASTPFGAELDSFSDFVSFGVSPAILLYLWNLQDAGPYGWVAVLLLCVAVALRLARFNVKNSTPASIDTAPKAFFEGVPAPAGAILALVPMMLSFKVYPEDEGSFPSFLVLLWVVFVAGLMVSRIPTYSLKRLRLKQKHMIPALAVVAFIVAALASEPWVAIVLFSVIYLASIPHAIRLHKKLYPEDALVIALPDKTVATATNDSKDEGKDVTVS